ncbi:MAG TPA: sortase [Gaiellaceae bacterium]|nr:sortase [Gaiellaceae bacterium]
MVPLRLAPIVLCLALGVLVVPAATRAAHAPNPNDPCVTGVRDTCGTTGVGFYKSYRYGTRWFGDYRGVVPGVDHLYCIDLRFWYPGRDYAYKEVGAAGLRNREGERISAANLQKAAYAIWSFGRTTSDNQAAAVMLYVHSLMGDARPGEVDPDVLNPTVESLYARIARDAARYHGPYRVDVALPATVGAGKTGTATIRVLSASGEALPDVDLALDATQGTAPSTAHTNANGVASVQVKATGAGGVHLTVSAEVPPTLPRIYRPTRGAAAANGQRLASAVSERVSGKDTASGAKAQLSLTTTATPSQVAAGGQSSDRVVLSGALPTYREEIALRLYGPFRDEAEISCDGTPFWTGTLAARGSGTYTTPAVALPRPGLYQYQETAPPDANHLGFTSPCTAPSERVRVLAAPTVHTVASAQTVKPGTAIHDTVTVSGLAGEHVTVRAALYGPFPARDAIRCTGTPAWTGTIDAPADGEYETEPFAPARPGFYTYLESIDAADFVRAVKTTCADVAETTVVTGTPALQTQVSAQQTRPGGTVTDRVVVSGAGALALPVRVELFGPFRTRGAITCSGSPYWRGSFVANGDGTYTTAPVRIDKAGYYTYRESIEATDAWSAVTTACAEVVETTVAHARPEVATLVSDEVVVPGGTIADRVRVRGLGKTAARIRVELFGPFAARALIRCSGPPHAALTVTATGDGELRTPPFRLARAGFYTFRERLIGSSLVTETTTECAVAAETGLARPEIVTGRGDVSRATVLRAGADAPVRVQIASLGIDAPVAAVGIDVRHGVLGVPPAIQRTAWWKDGAAPGARTGAVLIAGHVDSARLGAGAFFKLRQARAGDRVTVTVAGGRTFAYRVVSVRDYPKSRLPASVFSLRGRPRLVLVTCGGPFLPSEGHYRDNVVLTAVPVSS